MPQSIYYGKQTINQDDLDAVAKVLQSDMLTQGPAVSQFEDTLAQHVQVPYAIACNNGTAGLHLACLALDIGANDLVWVSAISFVASANCARYCGAKVRFIDVEPTTGNIDPFKLAEQLEHAAQSQQLPKALVIVHLGGQSCNMATISQLAHRYNIKIIEDACHALGSTYQGSPVGCCHYSDCTVFSFHPVKSITTAEGGMVTCKRESLALKIRQLASHGITKDEALWDSPEEAAPWYYEQQTLGYNYRLSDLQAALGLSQLNRLEQFISIRQEIASRYQTAFKGLLRTQVSEEEHTSAYHLFIIYAASSKQRKMIYQQLAHEHIFTQLHYIPIYRQPYYRQCQTNDIADYPGAEYHYQHALSLPIYPTLTAIDQQRIIDIVHRAIT